jgi:hypothetical protein
MPSALSTTGSLVDCSTALRKNLARLSATGPGQRRRSRHHLVGSATVGYSFASFVAPRE